MDGFACGEELLLEYDRFSRSFTRIRAAADIPKTVDEAYAASRFRIDPHIQLNPKFVPCGPINDLVSSGTSDPECAKIYGDREPITNSTSPE